MFCYLDIETLPPSGGGHYERIKAAVKPPGQYKKADSIEQWMTENADIVATEEFGRLGLDGLYGEVCCIGFALDGADITVGRVGSATCPTERELIALNFSAIDRLATLPNAHSSSSVIVVGHNIEFDIRFLFQRAVRYGIAIPHALRAAFDPEKGRYNTIDTMRVWAGWKGAVKLKALTRELLDDAGDDIDGSEVSRTWRDDPSKVAEHCQRDVQRVRDLHRKIRAVLA